MGATIQSPRGGGVEFLPRTTIYFNPARRHAEHFKLYYMLICYSF